MSKLDDLMSTAFDLVQLIAVLHRSLTMYFMKTLMTRGCLFPDTVESGQLAMCGEIMLRGGGPRPRDGFG